MFGHFNEEALARYEELVQQDYREKKVAAVQGTEKHDNGGIGEVDSSFIDNDESQDADDYSECYDFTTCIRADGSLYGIRGGKCRQGNEIDRASVEALRASRKPGPKARKAAAIQKRGERSLKQATAEKVLAGLQKEGKKEAQTKARAEDRRRAKDPYTNRDRVGQIQGLVGKATRVIDRLQERRKRIKQETDYSRKLDARIARLKGAVAKLQKEKERLQKLNPPKGEGFGRIPAAFETGRSLA